MITLTERIVHEAGELFFQKGVRNVTMNDIAEHLGMSKRTIYEQISDKDELLTLCIEKFSKREFEEVEEEAKKYPDTIDLLKYMMARSLENMTSSVGRFFEEVKKYHPKVYLSVVEKYRKQQITYAVEFIREGIKQEVFLPVQDIDFTAVVLVDLCPMLEKNDELEKRITPESLRWVALTFFRGISTPKGIERMDKAFTI